MYPNPANDNIIVTGGVSCSDIEIYNSIGEILPVQGTLIKAGVEIDLRSQPAGIYYIRIKDGRIYGAKKIIKE